MDSPEAIRVKERGLTFFGCHLNRVTLIMITVGEGKGGGVDEPEKGDAASKNFSHFIYSPYVTIAGLTRPLSFLRSSFFHCHLWPNDYIVQSLYLILPCIQCIRKMHSWIGNKILLKSLCWLSGKFMLSSLPASAGRTPVRISNFTKIFVKFFKDKLV